MSGSRSFTAIAATHRMALRASRPARARRQLARHQCRLSCTPGSARRCLVHRHARPGLPRGVAPPRTRTDAASVAPSTRAAVTGDTGPKMPWHTSKFTTPVYQGRATHACRALCGSPGRSTHVYHRRSETVIATQTAHLTMWESALTRTVVTPVTRRVSHPVRAQVSDRRGRTRSTTGHRSALVDGSIVPAQGGLLTDDRRN